MLKNLIFGHNFAETVGDENYLVEKIVAFLKRSLINNKEKRIVY